MSQAYRLTGRAEADVEAITDFIAADNLNAAVKVVLAPASSERTLKTGSDQAFGKRQFAAMADRLGP